MSAFESYSDVVTKKGFFDPLTRIGQVKFYKAEVPDVDHLDEDDFHIISSNAKKVIFRKHLPTAAAQEEKGRGILGRLTRLAPSIARHFEVKSSPVENMTFRLWAQRETNEMREDAYVALSYCWDLAKYPPRPGVKYPLPISSLMFSALASERQWRTTGVWIDQLCIDQKDKVEKSVSVAAMDSIYRCAQLVVVALLDVQVPLAQQDFLRDFIPRYESDSDMGVNPYVGETPPFFEKHPVFKRLLYYTILKSRWFTRAWCSHEMEMGENFVFYVPCQPVSANAPTDEMLGFTSTFLWDMLMLSAEVPKGPGEEPWDLRDRLAKVFDMRRRIARVYQSITEKSTDPSKDDSLVLPYTAQIRDIFNLGAGGDPDLQSDLRKASAYRDKTSIILNTLGNGLAVTGDLNAGLTEEECMRRLMLLGLAANDPTVLCTIGPHFNSPKSPDTLSWLCKPTYEDLGSGAQRRDYFPCMPQIHANGICIDQNPSLRWIEIDVLVLPGPQPPSERYRSLATKLTQKGIELGMGRAPPGRLGDVGAEHVGKTDLVNRVMLMVIDASTDEWGPGPLYQYWHSRTFLADSREQFNWALACLLECGMKWTLGMARKCGYPRPPFLEEKLRAFFETDDFAGIESMNWANTQVGREAADALFSAANFLVNWGAIRVHKKKFTNYRPLLFNHGSGGKAIVFTVSDALVQVVVPRLLLPDDYGRLYRVWLLQAKDDPFYEKMTRGKSVEWFLRGKGILFTDVEAKNTVYSEGSAGDGMPGWRLRKGVRVHGPPLGFQRE